MNVLVYRRGRSVPGARRICRQPVFEKGASATDQSLIGTGRSLVVENNYGYSGPTATQQGGTTSPGLERVDLDPGGGCHSVWRSAERAPSVVPKLSAANGLVYTYTKDPQPQDPTADAWYLTALDFRSGRTVYKRLGGEGFGHNNNYAPVTLGPDGTAYVGVLGGLIAIARPRAAAGGEGAAGGRAGARACGGCGCTCGGWGAGGARGCGCWAAGRGWCGGWTSTGAGRRVARDRRRPFRRVVRVGRGRVRMRARIVLKDGRRVTRTRRVARVRSGSTAH